MSFLVYVIPALLITIGLAIYNKLKTGRFHVTLKELIISMGINIGVALFCGMLIEVGKVSRTSDYTYVSGKVTKKYSDEVSCEHSYSVCTTTGKVTTCVTHYHHSYDIDWVVETTVGRFYIDRLSSRGLEEPPRFTKVEIGELATASQSFRNYLLIDKNNLLVTKGNKTDVKFPETYDYYRYNYFNNHTKYDIKGLNDLVGSKVANTGIIPFIIITKGKSIEYSNDVLNTLTTGKINSLIIIYNIDKDNNITWSKVGTYASGNKNEEMISTLEYMTLGNKLTPELIGAQMDYAVKHFKRVDIEEFSYMMDTYDVPLFLDIFFILIGIVVSLVTHKCMKENGETN